MASILQWRSRLLTSHRKLGCQVIVDRIPGPEQVVKGAHWVLECRPPKTVHNRKALPENQRAEIRKAGVTYDSFEECRVFQCLMDPLFA